MPTDLRGFSDISWREALNLDPFFVSEEGSAVLTDVEWLWPWEKAGVFF
jgi:hypothetical protein